MYARFTINVTGENFNPTEVLSGLKTSLVIDDFGIGYLYLVHKNEFSSEFPDINYEIEFVKFFEENSHLLKAKGADTFSIFMDIYYSDQCNFEIFNKDLLNKLAKHSVSLPISVFKEEITDDNL
ncbi:interleukin [Neisseria yangbaofengii]|uniref:interleukin n=1 Tax=Neisseria yangbaofengii TaxID=2709396 RepID=UPI0018690AA4|nr:interleukin [Neisseria yangbaofengii]